MSLKEIVKLSDERMYEDKEMYYKNKDIDRKGIKTAFEYVEDSIVKILIT